MFEWHEEKRQRNLDKHGLDFLDFKEIWQGPVVEIFSSQAGHSEARIIAIGMLDDRCITVIYTWREEKRRLISARKARKNE
ncbi:BrnT family toxin [Nitrosococcus watsonii]|uniref:BrnT family toxin n=1 Tax=Nitrosococcus watsoni (strain C-113) TaxID=105559 RepID=D8K986_NITWC|nr:BrnT family toxin [Nitrosococcus watsonii]ADJ29229.1 protein of unknown function DUF497 [Nitrosococcus watsonii C-113]